MPAYSAGSATNSIFAIWPGDLVTVWNAETPAAGTGGASASQQVALGRRDGESLTPFAVDLQFSGAPGAFEVDAQVAETDVDSAYQTVAQGNILAVDATNFTAHFSANAENARFARLLMRNRTNAVNVTATIKR